MHDFYRNKTGRKVTSIKFHIKSNIVIDEVCATKSTNKSEKYSTEDIKIVQSIFKETIDVKAAESVLDSAKGNVNIIREKYDLPRKSDVGNVVGWVRDAIKSDYKAKKGKSTHAKGSFTDYEQREINFEVLEEKLGERVDSEEIIGNPLDSLGEMRKQMSKES